MKEKCLEYYMDASIYSKEEIEASIEETKKEFANKNVYVDICLNRFGVYIITFYFENKNTLWNKIGSKYKENKSVLLQKDNETKNPKSRLEKYYGMQYGKYKETKVYRPY